MGVDVNLYAEADPTAEELAVAEEFFIARSGIGYGAEAVLIPENEEWFQGPRVVVDTMARYYGPGYERGPWPDIYGGIRVLQAAFPEAKVFYGGDSTDDGIECTDEYLAEIWEHFLGPHGNDYRSRQ
jgi:hypothetical protein